MSGSIDDQVWAGVERRLAAVERFVPEAPPWRPADRTMSVATVRIAPVGASGRGSGAARRTGSRLTWALIVIGLGLALVAGAALIGVGGHPRPTRSRRSRQRSRPGSTRPGP